MPDKILSIPNTNAKRRSHSIIPDHGDDYVLAGCNLTIDGQRLVVSNGTVTIADGDTVHAVEVDGRTMTVAGGTQSNVYYDLSAEEVVVQDTAPSSTSLQLGTVDEPAGTTDSSVNRRPNTKFGAINGESISGVADEIVPSGADTARIQEAIDDAAAINGTVAVPGETFTLDVMGQDAQGVDYCLEMRSGVTLVIREGATLEYPAENTGDNGTPPDVASPILCEGVDDWTIRLDGTVDGGAHESPQAPNRVDAMGIKIGCRQEAGTGCKRWRVTGTGTVTGAYRHGIEAIQQRTEKGIIEWITFDDGSGDDDVSISGYATDIEVRGVTSINKNRDGDWSQVCFEVEDGASDVDLIQCRAYGAGNSTGGFQMGKNHKIDNAQISHSYTGGENVRCIDCVADGNDVHGFSIYCEYDTITDYQLINCVGTNNTNAGAMLTATTNTDGDQGVVEDALVRGGTYAHNGGSGIGIVNDGIHRRPRVIGPSVHHNGSPQVRAGPGTGTFYDMTIREVQIPYSDYTGIKIAGDGTNWGGLSVIEDCRLDNINWDDIAFDSTAARQFVVTRENLTGDDVSPSVPSNPTEGTWYLDDGTNTGSGTAGKRVYLGGAWVDAYTA